MPNSFKVFLIGFVSIFVFQNNAKAQVSRHLFSEYKYEYIQYDSCFLESFGNNKNFKTFTQN